MKIYRELGEWIRNKNILRMRWMTREWNYRENWVNDWKMKIYCEWDEWLVNGWGMKIYWEWDEWLVDEIENEVNDWWMKI